MSRIAGMGVSLCVALGLAACDAANATGPGESAPAQTVVSAAAAPHNVTLSGPRTVKGYLEGSDEYGAPCGDGQGITITSTGVGTVSHFGRAVMVSTTCVKLDDFSVIGAVPFSIQAANGDEAGGFLTDFVYTSYGFDLYTSITWGTGRFQGASGELVFPTQSTFSGVWTSGVEGWITY